MTSITTPTQPLTTWGQDAARAACLLTTGMTRALMSSVAFDHTKGPSLAIKVTECPTPPDGSRAACPVLPYSISIVCFATPRYKRKNFVFKKHAALMR